MRVLLTTFLLLVIPLGAMHAVGTSNPSSTEHTQIEVTPSEEPKKNFLNFDLEAPYNNEIVALDDASVEGPISQVHFPASFGGLPIPEPATLAIFGAGLLLLLRKRSL